MKTVYQLGLIVILVFGTGGHVMSWGVPSAQVKKSKTINIGGVSTSQVPAGAPGTYTDANIGTVGYSPTPLNAAYQDPTPAPVDNGPGPGSGPYDPTTDPVYAAYIANLDLQLAQQQSNTERQRAALLGQQDNSLADSAQAGELSRQNISGNYESRGLFNSGGRLRDISQQQADQGTRESRIRQGTATGISDLENALAQAQAHATLLKQGASQGLFQ